MPPATGPHAARHLPTDTELLTLWEQADGRPPAVRALAALHRVSDCDVSTLPLGARDAALLSLYATRFGPLLEGVATCPRCGQDVDVAVPVRDVLVGAGPGAGRLEVDGYLVRFHAPTAGELAEIAAGAPASPPGADSSAAADTLLARCVEECTHASSPVNPVDLPAGVRDALEAAMAEADPGAELMLAMDCPDCACHWTQLLDPVPFLWREVRAAAVRIAEQVHAIASAYGWSEQDILAMTPRRRRLYLELVSP
jgi:hypothetical protein